MSYATVETALATQLAAVDGFSAAQISLDDWSILAKGQNPALVLGYDGFTSQLFTADAEYLDTWQIVINLLIRYQSDSQFHSDSLTYRKAIRDRLGAYPRLGSAPDSGILKAWVTDGEPLTKRATGGALEAIQVGNARYGHEILRVSIEEDADYVLAG